MQSKTLIYVQVNIEISSELYIQNTIQYDLGSDISLYASALCAFFS